MWRVVGTGAGGRDGSIDGGHMAAGHGVVEGQPSPEDVFAGGSVPLAERLRGAARSLAGSGESHFIETTLITTLNEVAGAVSSAMSVEAVLDVIVERAKSITDTEKAVLALAHEGGHEVDLDTIVVRGERGTHSQSWWGPRLDDLAAHVFATGAPALEHHPEEQAVLLASPLLVKHRPVGILCAINSSSHVFRREHYDFLSVLSAFAASAIENARLAEQSRYVLIASERDRIAREMHDGVLQSLFSISLGLELCKKQVYRDPAAVSVRLDELQQHLNNSMTELRRFIYDLRPMKLAELGLIGAVEYWVREITQGRDIRGHVVIEGTAPWLTPSEEACLYRVAKEAVSNVVKHSGASTFEVCVEFDDRIARLRVSDDGRGFDVERVLGGDTQGIGLNSIRDRVAREGGTLGVRSDAGSGTVLSVELPVGGSA